MHIGYLVFINSKTPRSLITINGFSVISHNDSIHCSIIEIP